MLKTFSVKYLNQIIKSCFVCKIYERKGYKKGNKLRKHTLKTVTGKTRAQNKVLNAVYKVF